MPISWSLCGAPGPGLMIMPSNRSTIVLFSSVHEANASFVKTRGGSLHIVLK